ncbi:hypothetical protein [Helicobacter mustelae]|uniref:Uncharacterized protein n=1 Tax=Helicobacter mustelae (strain ATCC 43772 / CCUG 25715 / CIP 103759 / LMG 18044 / NCTC 12198 / R85-136P) TaxID=679897 RepID=D3UJB3_HELM1|nr:hypothetical protein [Helicobacter mustelae]CBG40588.1 Putative hypothetical protein [Helicobacter mustelae 12198]SQH72085.1 Uncharacterised protein [Helicobacter mustelae]STP13229.1 Uncharacterised protein [Helicobacter mustelae]
MYKKIHIQVAEKCFELELQNFDAPTQKELIDFFENKTITIDQILKAYISKIQENQQMSQKISQILEKIHALLPNCVSEI